MSAISAGLTVMIAGLGAALAAAVPPGPVRVATVWAVGIITTVFVLAALWSRRPRPLDQVRAVLNAQAIAAVFVPLFVMVLADRPAMVACVILALVCTAGLMPQRYLVRGLGVISVAVVLIAAGADSFSPDWLLCAAEMVAASAGALLVQASRREPLIELARATRALAEQAVTDELTGLCNRRGLFQYAADVAARATTRGVPVPVLFVDVDGLKIVNDTLGHTAGDELIRGVAGVLAYCSRDGDVLARIGGDEFVLLLADDAATTVARIEHQVAEVNGQHSALLLLGRTPIPSPRAPQSMSLSIGTSLWHPPQTGLNEVLDRADKAMYERKRARRSVP